MEQIIDTLQAILRTLDAVEVKGKQNLDRQLGAIMGIEKVLNSLLEKENENGNNKS